MWEKKRLLSFGPEDKENKQKQNYSTYDSILKGYDQLRKTYERLWFLLQIWTYLGLKI